MNDNKIKSWGYKFDKKTNRMKKVAPKTTADQIEGQIPIEQMAGNLPSERIEGMIPIEQVAGSLPSSRIDGQIPIEQIAGDLSVTAENFEGILPILKGGTESSTADGARSNITSLGQITHAQLNDHTFWINKNGVSVAYCPYDNQGLQPYYYGLVISTNVNTDVQQIFMGTDGNTYRRWCNHYGWNGTADILGQSVWRKTYTDSDFVIQQGSSAIVTIPANDYKDIEIIYPKPFKTAPVVIPVPYTYSSYRSFSVGLNTTTNLTQKASFKVKSNNSGEVNTFLMWLAIGT